MASHRLCADNGVVGCWIRSMVQDSPRVYLGKRGLGAAWFVGRGARDVLLLLLTITSVGVSERRYPARTPPARCNVLALPRRMPPNQAQALMRLAGGSTMDDADGVEEHADGVEEEESDELPNLVEQDFDKLLRVPAPPELSLSLSPAAYSCRTLNRHREPGIRGESGGAASKRFTSTRFEGAGGRRRHQPG